MGIPIFHITWNGVQPEQVDRIHHFNNWKSSDERADLDIKCRIGQEKKAFIDLSNVLCARAIRPGS